MLSLLYACLDAAFAAVFLIPLYLYLNKRKFHDWKKAFGYFVFSIYLCAMFAVVGLPDVLYIRFEPNFNFIPFAYMLSDYMNSLLNVILFLPMGFFLPMFWEKFRGLGPALLFGFCTSLLIEILQIFTFRATDVNDLITNTFGTLLGWSVFKLLALVYRRNFPAGNPREIYWVCGSAFIVMFFFQPFLANFLFGMFL